MQMMELHAESDERLGTSGVTVCNTRLEGRDQSHPCVEVFSAKLCLRRPEAPQRSWGSHQWSTQCQLQKKISKWMS